jgi:general secretion pathway protein J
MRATPTTRRVRGFTLLEVLIAMAIFAVIGVMAMTGYSQLARQSENLQLSMDRIRAVQMTMSRFSQDFAELEPRPVREPLGSNSEPAVFADNRGQSVVQFTRAGWSNPAAIARSTLQRAAYRLENGKLFRDHWTVLDRTLATKPVQVELLDQVSALKLRYMDRNRSWSEQWPPATMSNNSAQGANDSERPIAIEVTLELEDWGKLVRVIEVPG